MRQDAGNVLFFESKIPETETVYAADFGFCTATKESLLYLRDQETPIGKAKVGLVSFIRTTKEDCLNGKLVTLSNTAELNYISTTEVCSGEFAEVCDLNVVRGLDEG